MSQEIYTKEEHYQDWKSEYINSLKDEFIDEVTDGLYDAYGSGTGVLFGISSELKPSVRAIVKVVLNKINNGKSDEFEAYCRQAFKDRD